MGYRSQVKYVIRFKDSIQIDNFKELVKHKADDAMTQALEELRVFNNNLYAEFDDVKWYDSYEGVQAHHKLMEFAREAFADDAAWRFVRIGEEYNDIEILDDDPMGDLYDVIYPIRSIELNF